MGNNAFGNHQIFGGGLENNGQPRWGYLMTQVIDSGMGINPKNFKGLFQTFSNSKISVFSSQGVGIGLSTSRQLASAMGGGLYLESKVEEGTNATFTFQVRDQDETLDLN